MSSRRALAGYSLVELITVLTLVAVLASLAAPAFSAYLQRLRMRAVLDRLAADLYHARSLAVRMQARLRVRFDPSSGCARAYSIVRADDGRTLLTVPVEGAGRGVCLTSNRPQSLSIDARGMLVGSPRTLRVRAGRQVDSATISIVGRVYRWY